jgi:hypothetical protein
MIRIRLETRASSFNGTPKNFITCPQCLKEDWFYNYLIRSCLNCSFFWGNTMLLLDDVNARVAYFKEGEIIENKS